MSHNIVMIVCWAGIIFLALGLAGVAAELWEDWKFKHGMGEPWRRF